MMAAQGGDTEEITTAVCNTVNDHLRTEGIKAENLPQAEVELLIVNMRAKSVGEKLDLVISDPEDGKEYKTHIMLNELEIIQDKDFKTEIEMKDGRILCLSVPGINSLDGMNDDMNEFDSSIHILSNCFKSVVDGDEMYARDDVPVDDIKEFFLTLDTGDFNLITESFFSKLPTLSATAKAKRKDKTVLEVKVTGLASFL